MKKSKFYSSSSSSKIIFSPENLEIFAAKIFRKLDLPEEDSYLISKCLVHSNLRNQDGHGVSRIPIYVKRLRHGLVNPNPGVKIEKVATSACLVDGDNGMGFVVASKGMDSAIQLALENGIGIVGIKNSTHFGSSAHYVLQAIEKNMISIVLSNSSPAQPPWGAAAALLGASPLAAGAPSGQAHPFVLDMATTVIARGKLRLASERGEKIPMGVGLDKNGRPTQDGMEAFHGVTLPFGGMKGAAITM